MLHYSFEIVKAMLYYQQASPLFQFTLCSAHMPIVFSYCLLDTISCSPNFLSKPVRLCLFGSALSQNVAGFYAFAAADIEPLAGVGGGIHALAVLVPDEADGEAAPDVLGRQYHQLIAREEAVALLDMGSAALGVVIQNYRRDLVILHIAAAFGGDKLRTEAFARLAKHESGGVGAVADLRKLLPDGVHIAAVQRHAVGVDHRGDIEDGLHPALYLEADDTGGDKLIQMLNHAHILGVHDKAAAALGDELKVFAAASSLPNLV